MWKKNRKIWKIEKLRKKMSEIYLEKKLSDKNEPYTILCIIINYRLKALFCTLYEYPAPVVILLPRDTASRIDGIDIIISSRVSVSDYHHYPFSRPRQGH